MLEYPKVLRRETLEKGDRGVTRTLEVMTKLAERATEDPNFRLTVIDLLRKVPPYNSDLEVKRLFRYVRDAIQYRRDPVGKEYVADPVHTLRIGAGDCDDKATLLKAMLATVGYPSKFVVSGIGRRFPAPRFQHVFLLTRIPRHGWIPLDPTRKFNPGYLYPGTTRAGVYGGRGTIKEASVMRDRVPLSQPLVVPRRMLQDGSAREFTGLYISQDGLELDEDLAGLFSGLKKIAKGIGKAVGKVSGGILSVGSSLIPGGGLVKGIVQTVGGRIFGGGGDAPAPAPLPPAPPMPLAARTPPPIQMPAGPTYPASFASPRPPRSIILPGIAKPSPATSSKTILMVGGGILLLFMMMMMMQRRS
jgi:hypothetical protein